jgi:hypothetical protein
VSLYPVRIDGIELYQIQLDLDWPVSYFVKLDESTCRITCLPDERRHEVWLSPSAAGNPRLFLSDIVHELCHAKLAELIEVAFSTLFFRRRYGSLKGQAEQQFQRKSQYLYWSWAQVDICVNDLRYSRWPELAFEDRGTFLASLMELAERGQADYLSSNEAVFGLALQTAETERHAMPEVDLSGILEVMTRDARQTYQKLLAIYRALPQLSLDPRTDLLLLEGSVQRVAKKLRFPISPKLVSEEGRRVWEV